MYEIFCKFHQFILDSSMTAAFTCLYIYIGNSAQSPKIHMKLNSHGEQLTLNVYNT